MIVQWIAHQVRCERYAGKSDYDNIKIKKYAKNRRPI